MTLLSGSHSTTASVKAGAPVQCWDLTQVALCVDHRTTNPPRYSRRVWNMLEHKVDLHAVFRELLLLDLTPGSRKAKKAEGKTPSLCQAGPPRVRPKGFTYIDLCSGGV